MSFKRLDVMTIFIVVFALVLVVLFFQLREIASLTTHYHSFHKVDEQLLIYNDKIDKTFDRKFTFINFDKLNHYVELMRDEIAFLQSRHIEEMFGDKAALLVKKAEEDFYQKVEETERFKSVNSGILNSLHFLFDLQKTLYQEESDRNALQNLVNDILFTTLQMMIHLDIDMETLQAKLARLDDTMYDGSEHMQFFVMHSRHVIREITRLNDILNRIRAIDYEQSIRNLDNYLHNTYQANRVAQTRIIYLMFISSIGFIVMLLINYRRSYNAFLELQAFKYAVENSDNSIVITNKDRVITYVNDFFERDSGFSRVEIIGQYPSVLKSGEMSSSFYDQLNQTLNKGEKWEGEFINRRKDGTLYYEKASIVPIIVDNELINYLAIKLNITDYINQNRQLQQSAVVFEHTDEGIYITDSDLHIISVNKTFLQTMSYKEEELLGQRPNIFKSGLHDDEFYRHMWESINTTGLWKGKIYNKDKSGDIIPSWVTISTVHDVHGNVINYIAIYTDLQEIMASQERVEYLAHHDSLTGLPNRRKFEEHLHHVIDSARRNHHEAAVLFIDLDRFKVINDTLGHHIGDELLKTVAERFKTCIRESEILARIGGDEFVVIIETLQHDSDPAHISQRLLDVLDDPIVVDNHTLNTTASIGIALFPNDGEDVETILKHADSAMYHAKNIGKNNFQYFTNQLSDEIHRRMEIEQAMRLAIQGREFSVHYQPQYDLSTYKIVGAEALVRWENSSLGSITPDEFIPVAEESGMIIQIGEFVMEEACHAFMEWKSLGLEIDTIAINVSSIQFTQTDIIATLKRIMEKTGILPENLDIEITERYLFDYTHSNQTILDEMRSLGIKISIDDFGTGYSSMSYLKELPLDTIKIDKSFIDDIPYDTNDIEITKAIIALSSSLGYETVAEGIETEEQERFLKDLGCQFGQGYYFQKPVASDRLAAFAKTHQSES